MNKPCMKPVSSSQLSEMGYSATNAQLFVRFHPSKTQRESGQPGSLYSYSDVPMDVWDALNADGVSVGSTFIRLVKSVGYAFTKLEG